MKNGSRLMKNDILIYCHSWYCKNMNRSQAEKLLKTEVNPVTGPHNGREDHINWFNYAGLMFIGNI